MNTVDTVKTTAVRKITLVLVTAGIAGIASLMGCNHAEPSKTPVPASTYSGTSGGCTRHVNGYTRKDGTVVAGYDRSC